MNVKENVSEEFYNTNYYVVVLNNISEYNIYNINNLTVIYNLEYAGIIWYIVIHQYYSER